jgi:hypothetical protein
VEMLTPQFLSGIRLQLPIVYHTRERREPAREIYVNGSLGRISTGRETTELPIDAV